MMKRRRHDVRIPLMSENWLTESRTHAADQCAGRKHRIQSATFLQHHARARACDATDGQEPSPGPRPLRSALCAAGGGKQLFGSDAQGSPRISACCAGSPRPAERHSEQQPSKSTSRWTDSFPLSVVTRHRDPVQYSICFSWRFSIRSQMVTNSYGQFREFPSMLVDHLQESTKTES
jgi:hypothetical protein